MSDIQKQCWDNYHATWAKQDEQTQDRILIELINNSMIENEQNKKKEPVWSPSHREEVIAGLFFIAAFTAFEAEMPGWFCYLLLIKATFDYICCCLPAAWKENKEDKQL